MNSWLLFLEAATLLALGVLTACSLWGLTNCLNRDEPAEVSGSLGGFGGGMGGWRISKAMVWFLLTALFGVMFVFTGVYSIQNMQEQRGKGKDSSVEFKVKQSSNFQGSPLPGTRASRYREHGAAGVSARTTHLVPIPNSPHTARLGLDSTR
ncbi:MAG: hypothetical protein J0L64_20655 [Acidobacteria bacterium]|nr:hypothetical protein [Acidobacteriota bacterium]